MLDRIHCIALPSTKSYIAEWASEERGKNRVEGSSRKEKNLCWQNEDKIIAFDVIAIFVANLNHGQEVRCQGNLVFETRVRESPIF